MFRTTVVGAALIAAAVGAAATGPLQEVAPWAGDVGGDDVAAVGSQAEDLVPVDCSTGWVSVTCDSSRASASASLAGSLSAAQCAQSAPTTSTAAYALESGAGVREQVDSGCGLVAVVDVDSHGRLPLVGGVDGATIGHDMELSNPLAGTPVVPLLLKLMDQVPDAPWDVGPPLP